MENDKEKILEFARQHNVCVLSTAQDNKPQSAVVDFLITDKFEIVFNCSANSKKYKNLLMNPNVAIVIGFGETLKTIQCEGLATPIDGHVEDKIVKENAESLLFSRRWKNQDMKFFKVQLNWVRYTDYSDQPPFKIELNVEDF